MKAIICAAGIGTRLGNYTKNLPKCLLEFEGKSLLERQIETLKSSGIEDISIVRGYKPEKINAHGVKYYENSDFAETNMVVSLMAAEKELSGSENFLVCYSDILYERRLIEYLKESDAEVSVLVDDDWIPYWKSRSDNWKSDIESLTYSSDNKIIDIGNPRCSLEEAQSRYIGLIKFNERGISEFKRLFYENKEKYWHSTQPWLRSKSFKQAYMTCMLQEMVNGGVDVRAVHTKRGWLEFDTIDDIEKANKWVQTRKIRQFISLDQ